MSGWEVVFPGEPPQGPAQLPSGRFYLSLGSSLTSFVAEPNCSLFCEKMSRTCCRDYFVVGVPGVASQ